jgi:hypothetical protein
MLTINCENSKILFNDPSPKVGEVLTVAINTPGSGYTVDDEIYLTTEQGGDAALTVTEVGESGEVTAISVLYGGSGYLIENGVETTGGTGSGLIINITDVKCEVAFYGGGYTYNNIEFDCSGEVSIVGDNTFNQLKFKKGLIVDFADASNQTVSDFVATGAVGELITLTVAEEGTGWTLTKISGVVACDYLDLSYSTATGGALFYAGNNSNDGGSNSGWLWEGYATFYKTLTEHIAVAPKMETTPQRLEIFLTEHIGVQENYQRAASRSVIFEETVGASDNEVEPFLTGDRFWVGGTGAWNADAASHWAAESNGTPNAKYLPSPINNVIIDENSGFGAGGTITLDGSCYCNDFTSTSGDEYTILEGLTSLYVYGSLTLEAGITIDSVYIYMCGTGTGNTVTTAGVVLYVIIFGSEEADTGEWILQDDLVALFVNPVNGTFDLNNKNVTCDFFANQLGG